MIPIEASPKSSQFPRCLLRSVKDDGEGEQAEAPSKERSIRPAGDVHVSVAWLRENAGEDDAVTQDEEEIPNACSEVDVRARRQPARPQLRGERDQQYAEEYQGEAPSSNQVAQRGDW